MTFSTLITTLLPIYLIFVLGVVLRKAGFLTRDETAILLKTIFYVCLPALVAYSILNARLSLAYAVLPFISPVIVVLTFGISWGVCHSMNLPAPTRGTFFVGTMVSYVAFMYPIIQELYGVEGVSKLAMFDAGHAVMAFSFSYFIACWYSPQSKTGQFHDALVNMLKNPPLWAIMMAILLNVLRIPVPATLKQTLLFLGNGTTPLLMLSMGALFTPAIRKGRVILPALAVRMIGGSMLGIVCATLLHLEADLRVIVILAASAPVGQSTLTFSALKRLDVELAVSLVPVSVLFGMGYVSLLLWFL